MQQKSSEKSKKQLTATKLQKIKLTNDKVIGEKTNVMVQTNRFPYFNKITYANDEYDRQKYFDMMEKLDNQKKVKVVFKCRNSTQKNDSILGDNKYSKLDIEGMASRDQISQQLRLNEQDRLKSKQVVQQNPFKDRFIQVNKDQLNRKQGFDTRIFFRAEALIKTFKVKIIKPFVEQKKTVSTEKQQLNQSQQINDNEKNDTQNVEMAQNTLVIKRNEANNIEQIGKSIRENHDFKASQYVGNLKQEIQVTKTIELKSDKTKLVDNIELKVKAIEKQESQSVNNIKQDGQKLEVGLNTKATQLVDNIEIKVKAIKNIESQLVNVVKQDGQKLEVGLQIKATELEDNIVLKVKAIEKNDSQLVNNIKQNGQKQVVDLKTNATELVDNIELKVEASKATQLVNDIEDGQKLEVGLKTKSKELIDDSELKVKAIETKESQFVNDIKKDGQKFKIGLETKTTKLVDDIELKFKAIETKESQFVNDIKQDEQKLKLNLETKATQLTDNIELKVKAIDTKESQLIKDIKQDGLKLEVDLETKATKLVDDIELKVKAIETKESFIINDIKQNGQKLEVNLTAQISHGIDYLKHILTLNEPHVVINNQIRPTLLKNVENQKNLKDFQETSANKPQIEQVK